MILRETNILHLSLTHVRILPTSCSFFPERQRVESKTSHSTSTAFPLAYGRVSSLIAKCRERVVNAHEERMRVACYARRGDREIAKGS